MVAQKICTKTEVVQFHLESNLEGLHFSIALFRTKQS